MMSLVNPPLELVEFTRMYLAAFYSLVAAFYTVQIILMKRSNSRELIFSGERFCGTWWNHMAFRLFRVGIWLICLFRVFQPSIDSYLGLIPMLETSLVILSGNILLTLGFISTIIIHLKLGKTWRSGIDPNGPKSIISKGFYKYSRNPMFLCVAISQFGFFLAIPSLFTLICLIIGIYTLYSQTLAEEKHLSRVLPLEYKNYSSQVRRWI
ncbi:isoprenylcysteine carboxylmethyltransferase family protein [Moritella marina ATCC 15381]|uniref:Isoprenylcysteine carboxylmethyltransferase family protein n=1 Tax=Moritella marina ATCC 15381 TaxID=1202962 RepID=A0A5J6WGT1_MORMI|nr:methyltransferase [Moritella marina]QFI37273.1 isoprenylcysteine carboxylmethyltransferase family protein [Moritella marina ATCC 15381]